MTDGLFVLKTFIEYLLIVNENDQHVPHIFYRLMQ
jgi:hypothetical protein